MKNFKLKVKLIMPDGDRSSFKHKIPNMLAKLFSFFKCKHRIYKKVDEVQIEEELNYWSHYKNLKAEEIMVPRADIVAMDYSNNLEEITRIFLENRHTRMPVFKRELDNIVGFVNIKDIFPYLVKPKENPKFNIDNVLRKMLVVSPAMKLFDLLEEMKKTRTHIAMVLDEFGGSDGLITIEDLVEEIIGEIEDEHDQVDVEFKEIKPGLFEVNGRIEIKDLEEKLQLNLNQDDNEDYETLGGLILSISGHVPAKGEKIVHAATGLVFEILESDPRRIKKVLVKK